MLIAELFAGAADAVDAAANAKPTQMNAAIRTFFILFSSASDTVAKGDHKPRYTH